MHKFAATLTIFSLVLGLTALAEEKPTEELSEAEIKARDYSYKSATFGMKLADFENEFAVGMPASVDPVEQKIQYHIQHSTGRQIIIVFKRKRLESISAALLSHEVIRVGGTTAIEEKLFNTFGRPEEIKDGHIIWRYPKVGRAVIYTRVDSGEVVITTTVLHDAINDTSSNDETVTVKFEY